MTAPMLAVPPRVPAATEAAEMVARILLETHSVLFNPDTPFIFTSGWASPVYIDCRRLIGFPRARQAITTAAVTLIERDIGFDSLEGIAGGETAGIPYAAWIAQDMALPMSYVRKKPKGFGANAQIEGVVEPGSRVLLVEDLATDGRSKVNFVTALRAAGVTVDHSFVVFYYAIFPHAPQVFADLGITLHSLATWWDVLNMARTLGSLPEATLLEVERFLQAPMAWSASHGGAGHP